jgi:D-alanyl-D-alanine carboxypeptidase
MSLMARHIGQILFMSVLCVLIFSISTSTASAKRSKGNPKYASIVMDADTGMILSQRYADKSLHPASLTKVMTLLLTFEALDRGLVKKSDRVRISNHAAKMVPSKLGLPAGSSIKVEDAIYILVTKSANDIAVALGEHIGGSESKFARLMTARARTIGMSKTNFRNASGLHHKYQVSSARDMAKMARYILQRYPHYYRYFSTKNFTYKGKKYRNHNRLMETYKGMDGFKTGYVNASGFNLVASAYRDGRRLIGVVFGGRSSKTRNSHMAEIMDVGFKKAGKVRIAHAKKPPTPRSKPLLNGGSDLAAIQQLVPKDMNGFTSLATLNSKTKIIAQKSIKPNYTKLTKALQSGAFGEMIGEGDFDPSISKRLETGLIAIAVHKGDYRPNPAPASAVEKSLRNMGHKVVSKMGEPRKQNQITSKSALPHLMHPKDIVGKWAVQIGAYNNRVATDEALNTAKKNLPPSLSKASPITVPLRTAGGMLFRARLGNLSQSEAKLACRYLKNCMTVAPISAQIKTR